MFMKRKSESGGTIGIIGAFVLVFIVVFFIGNWFRGTTADASTSFGSINLNNKHQLCELAGKKFIDRGQQVPEPIEGEIEFEKGKKGDDFPDDCDICLGGDDRKVTKNSLGIPDACYADPNKEYNGKKIKSYKDMCNVHFEACYISDTTQCCLLGKDKCGVKCK